MQQTTVTKYSKAFGNHTAQPLARRMWWRKVATKHVLRNQALPTVTKRATWA
jgi:hypothetical protein